MKRIGLILTGFALFLAYPASALAITINEEYKPQEEFKLYNWIDIKIGPIDLSINKFTLYVFLAAALTIFVMLYIARKMQQKPNRMQTAIEASYIFTRDSLVRENIDNKGIARRWFPFIATLFFFLWFSNMIGYIPLPTNSHEPVNIFGVDLPTFALYSATANLSLPLILTLIVWFSYQIEGVRKKGFGPYVKSFIPEGISGPILLLVAPIEVLSQFVRIVSLSARLFANMLAGHLLILIMGGGLAVLLISEIVGLLTLPVATGFYLFEVGLVASLQAFIFAILASIYLGAATGEGH